MASSDAWSDFYQIRHTIKNNTVDKLKQILSGLNEECHTHLSKSGKKQDIIDRISQTLDTWEHGKTEDKWLKAKAVIMQVRANGIYTPSRMSANSAVLPPSTISHMQYPTIGLNTKPYQSVAGPSTIGRYDPFAPPRKPSGSTAALVSASTSSAPKPPGIRFKESPFLSIEQAISGVIECPESFNSTDRKQQIVTFTLSNEQIAKLKSPGSKYQLRLFCTSSIFYSGPGSFRTSLVPCPIEFPPTCEVRVNNVQLTANLKGLKKKPGTAPPPDLGKYVRLTPVQNRVEMVYVNSQQPTQSKKYYLVVMLVETTTVEQLVRNLKSTSHRSSHEIKQRMIDSISEDDDIVAGPQKMSLKCPLSYMRVNTPCRSSKCMHSQCFDATSWFSVMEQTTTWLCPVCEKSLDCKELIIDGYFDEILKQSPESVEDVIVEADGEWHTSDNKYASTAWKIKHPPATPKTIALPIKPDPQSPSRGNPAGGEVNGKPKANHEIFVLDSDDEDEGRVKRELSPSFGSGSSANHSFDGTSATSVPLSQTQGHYDDVIDLTGDSDNEDLPESRQAGKRKAADADMNATSPTEQIWKKSRPDPDRAMPASVVRTTPSNHINGVDYTAARPAIPSSPVRFPNPYSSNVLPPIYFNNAMRGGDESTTQLPPIHSPHIPRVNGMSGWRS